MTASAAAASSRRTRVAIIFGGRSAEHGISCVTAGSVLQVLDPERYDVVPVGITRQGRWVLAAADPALLTITDGRLPEVTDTGATVVLPTDPSNTDVVVVDGSDQLRTISGVDVVLPLLHGPFGEDGTVQGLLELVGVPYVGSGVLASSVGMDKHMMKLVLQAAGLPVGRHVLVPPGDWSRQRAEIGEQVEELGWPVFVKPARGGSSLGISRVDTAAGLDAAVEEAREHDPKVVIEEFVGGREIECGVLEGVDGAPPAASVVGEIRIDASHTFYDFNAKYFDAAGVGLDVPADLDPDVVQQAQQLAVAAFTALACEGLARIDFFLRADGSLVVNEVNTMPGFTPTSMFPQLWAATGLPYPELVERLLSTALRRPVHPAGLR